MILLLDAHAILWAVSEPGSLAVDARSAIESPANDVVVSAGSIWELEIKQALGKIKIENDLLEELERVGFDMLAITAADATSAARLPLHHRDPFDRMLIAQAKSEPLILLTHDTAFAAYGDSVMLV